VTTALQEQSKGRGTSEALCMLPTMLARALGPEHRIRAMEHRPSSRRSTFAMEEIDVLLTNGELLRLILKTVGPQGLLPNARMSKPLFLHDPLREIEFQQHVLSTKPELGTPRLFSSVVEPARERYWMLSERVIGTTLEGAANIERWRSAARWLARMHTELAHLANEPLARGTLRLLVHGGDLLRMWVGRAITVVRAQDPFIPRDLFTGLQELGARYDAVVERLLEMPRAVIHGEFFGSNILLRHDPRLPLGVVDWDMAAIAPPLLDLAALCAHERDPGRRREIALSYHAALDGSPLVPADPTEFMQSYEICRLHLAIQWMGWSPDTTPPRGRPHDWLIEVLQLSEELGI
jgi:hypothetical protein